MTEMTLATLLRRDQRERWLRGDRVRVETYLRQQPGLRDQPEAVLDLIYNEIYLREEEGDRPEPDEYVQRFPEFESSLRMLFEVHRALEEPSPGPSPTPDDGGSRTAAPAPSELPAPRAEVPGYEILEELGRGGMGVVYLARQTRLKRLVALKMILAGPFAGGRLVNRFRLEADAVARLQHPHIVQIFDIGEHDGRPYLALEYVEGGSLAQKLAGTPQPARGSAELVEVLARTMHFAHRHRILHRDLKPANVLLALPEEHGVTSTPTGVHATGYGLPKITDFGLAKLLDTDSGQTHSDAVIGTPSYMAPEQAAGKTKEITAAADVYALGAILHEMLTGRPPFRGATGLETLEQVRSQEAVPPHTFQPKVPRDLEAICLKCLEKDPRRRYASAEELAEDLRRFLDGEPTRARPARVWQRAAKWVRRRPAAAALIALGALLLASVTVFAAMHYADRREQRLLQRQLGEEQARQQAQETYRQFIRRRDDALFYGIYGTHSTTADARAGRERTRAAAREALGLIGVAEGSAAAPAFDPNFSEAERADVAAGCYELLLVLADALAHPEPADDPGRLAESLRCLDVAARLAPPTQALHRRRADYLERLGDAVGAAREARAAEAIAPAAALDFFLLADEHYRRGEYAAAAADLHRALRDRPDHFWAQYYLAFCHLGQKSWAEAKVGLTACLGRRPDFVWTYLLRGFASAELGAFAEAEADFAQAEALPRDDMATAALHANRGALRLAEDRLDQASADLKEAVALRPGDYQPHMNLAKVYRKQNRLAEALAETDEAQKLGPPDSARVVLLARRGQYLRSTRRFEEAVRACDEALAVDPRFADAYGVSGEALAQLGRYREAVERLTHYLRESGKPDPAMYRLRAWCHRRLGNFPAAVQDYTLALAQPQARLGELDAYLNRGWSYFAADAWKLAAQDFDQAVRLDGGNADALVGRGLARVYLGHYRQAVEDADAALRLKPGGSEVFHNLACIFARAVPLADADRTLPDRQKHAANYRKQAVAALERAVALLPSDKRAAYLANTVAGERDLDAIRSSPEFQALLEKLAAQTPRR